MKKLRWQFVIILLTGFVVGFLLLSQQQQQQEQQQTPSSSLQATPVPATGGIYTEALVGSFNRFNPILAQANTPDRDVDRLIFSSLIRFDARGNPLPDLAESWGISKDGTLYNFSLRKDVLWHDGKTVTTDDVIFTIELMRASKDYLPADLLSFWKDVDVKRLSDQQIQFRLPESFSPFLDYLTFGILPKHLLGQITIDQLVNDPFNLKPVGSGPYRFDHFIVEKDKILGVVLKSFDKYFLHKPYIAQFVFMYYQDNQAALAAYKAGNVQGIGQVTPDILPVVLADPNLALYTARQPQMMMVYLNLNNPDVVFFQNSGFRRALLMSLNRQGWVDKSFAGQAVVADGPVMPGTWAYYDGIEHLAYDPATARSMLKDAGYGIGKDGTSLVDIKEDKAVSFQLLYPDQANYKVVAEAVKQDLSAIGISVELVAKPYDKLISENLNQRSYQAALVEIDSSQTPDPDPYPFWDQAQKTSGQNYAQWDNKTASDYLEQARVSIDQVERARLYRNFQVLFTKEMPSLPLFYPVFSYAIDAQVQGVQIGPLYEPEDRFAGVLNWNLLVKKVAFKPTIPAQNVTLSPTP